jgi:serine/threonine protein kinase
MGDLTGRRVGDYTLREQIGDGGHRDVYCAEHRVLKRVAVVKVLNEKQQCADSAKARFLREAQLASQLRHPNTAQVHDFAAEGPFSSGGLR